MNCSQYSLERYKILVYGLGKNLKKKFEVPVHMSEGIMKKKILGSPYGFRQPVDTLEFCSALKNINCNSLQALYSKSLTDKGTI